MAPNTRAAGLNADKFPLHPPGPDRAILEASDRAEAKVLDARQMLEAHREASAQVIQPSCLLTLQRPTGGRIPQDGEDARMRLTIDLIFVFCVFQAIYLRPDAQEMDANWTLLGSMAGFHVMGGPKFPLLVISA